MTEELQRFFKSISYSYEESIFDGASVEKVIYLKKKEVFEVYLQLKKVLPYVVLKDLLKATENKINGTGACKVYFSYASVMKEDVLSYLQELVRELTEKRPSLVNLNEALVNIEEEVITLEVSTKLEELEVKKEAKGLTNKLSLYGLGEYVLTSVLNEELHNEVKETLEKSKTGEIPVVPIENAFKTEQKPIEGEVISIHNILGDMKNVVVEAYVFGIDTMEHEKINIITLKISDKTNSLLAKVFKKDKNEYKAALKDFKEGTWYRMQGKVEFDTFSKDLVLTIRHYETIDSKEEMSKENTDTPRVELHTHTMMSAMDGVIDATTLVKHAVKMGQKAIGVTDHNCVQAFPDLYHAVEAVNKGKEGDERFKVLYGAEMNVVNDDVDIIFNNRTYNLLEDLYVVFDTETTGFNAAGGDQMIEIGAVKIQDGNIIDRFDELIDPGRHIPDKITELTCITDEMVKGKDNEEEVTKRFLAWTGDLPMVAHNAKFDISFIEMSMRKYNLGEFTNTVIDTLELSRTLDQGYSRHGLSALVKRYNVPWEEDAHHRADYDAEGTAYVFHKMLQKLIAQNFKDVLDLDKLISKDEIYKFGRTFHFNAIALNKVGLKNLFKIISLANTVYLYKTPRILRSKLEELREGLLIGSGCYESEVFEQAKSKEGQELTNIINFYDYVEVQPPEVYGHLIQTSDFKNEEEVKNHITKIVNTVRDAGKIIVATGDVHHFERGDKIYREIIVNQKVPGGGRHPLAKSSITNIPSQHFRTTREMLEDFNFLGDDLAYEIVVTNTNKVLDMVEEIEVIIDTGGIPFSPRVKSDDGSSYLDCPRVVTDLVYEKAASWYGDPLPHNIEERIAKELYGDIVYKCCHDNVMKENPDLGEEDAITETFTRLHTVLVEGFDSVKSLLNQYFQENWKEEDGELNDKTLEKKVKKELGGIIGGGFDPIYLISQRLVKHSNDDGYLVGSRGSVGSSFVATMMGITEVNPLPAHYRCLNCKTSVFQDETGKELGADYSSGFDLPDKMCPNCGEKMYKDGQDMPFATFLGFNADKVPDIDLNFSDLNQASAHEYTKVLFGVDNVYRAGTIGTVAEKTAFGFVKGYCEDHNKIMRTAEIERLAMGCTGVKRTTGQHPGGIVVVPDYMEVSDFTPFQFPADDVNSAWRTTHFDYHAIDQDLLKLDILGHSDPTQLRMIQDLTGMDILTVPLDDKETMSIFTSTKALGVTNEQIMNATGTLGIPEFGTPFTIGMVAETKPKTFAELIKISGLSHGTDVWLGNAQELIKNNIVPFKEVIGCRDDIMVYLMYHGVAPIKAFKIMEFVRKGKASKDPDTWAGHKATMEEAGIEKWFIDSCGKIKYMFPKAHAAAYVISAFRIAWYKVHMPVYFYASWLTSKATDVDVETMIGGYDVIKNKILEIQNKGYEATNKDMGVLESLKVCLEATARGIQFLPVDLNHSPATVWGVRDDTSIYPPFAAVDGLGDTVAKNIVEEREKSEFLSIEDVQRRAKVSGTLIDKLKSMGIFDGMEESNQMSLF